MEDLDEIPISSSDVAPAKLAFVRSMDAVFNVVTT
jgi:hypothetical protein